MSLGEIGRLVLGLAAVLAVFGAVLILAGRAGLGRLPGDVSFGGNGVHVYLPIATCLVVSVVGTIVLNLFFRR